MGAGDSAKPTSIGQGQNIRIENLSLEDGDTIRFVGTQDLDTAEFFDLVKPTTNPFADTTTLNFFNDVGNAVSVSFTIDQGFDQQLGAQDDLFVNFFDITTA
ncbi:MAG: hypothetical protein CMK02_08505 [Polycyclovorans sp.]|nr:hypothetical protein [Polycyclovorans sp.]